MSDHSERDLLRELFPDTARELFGSLPGTPVPTLGLYPVADGRMALVSGGRLAELEPIEQKGTRAAHCDLCHVTRSRSEAGIFRVRATERTTLYLTLCLNTEHCQRRAGRQGLEALAERVLQRSAVGQED
ncbi:hypothetical protein [Deinococcus aquiradiocola]|uniref:Uncharacterized protein n=1 Tax=Deinococcus aquiradiocola TaxID=393059 RepID=A0A917PDG1_9DEIO|nr:hypothetical protein [Deinococcus aquiradiocola]GGJ71816.1 hypothetical protein GCM10008939_15250 [Deinococcus aquiradiocola]